MLQIKITMLILYIITCFEENNIIPLCVNIGLICTQFGSIKFENNSIFQIYDTIMLSVQIILVTIFNKQLIVYGIIYLIIYQGSTAYYKKIIRNLQLLGISVLVIMYFSSNLIDYLRNITMAVGILGAIIKKQLRKSQKMKSQFQYCRAQSPRTAEENFGVMIYDSKLKKCIYMNEYLKTKIDQNSLTVKKIDSQSKQKLDSKIKNIDFFELLNIFQLKQLQSMQILDTNIMSDHIIEVHQDPDNFNIVNISFMNSRERDDFLKRSYLYQIMKQLFTTISHEFGTLLNYTLAITQVAVDKYPAHSYYRSIKHTCEIMHNFILDMVDYNDILGNQFKLQLEQLDLTMILESVCQLFQEQCNQKQLKLEYENHIPDNWQIYSDHRRIKQILIHLIGNAQKFTMKGSIKIKVLQLDDEMIQFSITDTGIGMNSDEENNLREMIKLDFKNEQQISQNTAGFGLGCYLANKLCLHLSNQKQSLQFKTDKMGTTFWFVVSNNQLPTSSIKSLGIQQINKYQYIDLKQSQIERSINRKLSRLASKVSSSSIPKLLTYKGIFDSIKENTESLINEEVNSIERKNRTQIINRKVKQSMKFLIVDDEMINIIGLQLILKRMNIEIDYAFNGIECLQKIQENGYQYSGIFMDINMPLMDGYQTSQRLIQLYGSQIKIIACTAYTDSDTKQRCYETGMSYFLNKPVNIVELQKILIQFQQ